MSKTTKVILTVVATVVWLGITVLRWSFAFEAGNRHPGFAFSAVFLYCYVTALIKIWGDREKTQAELQQSIKEREKEFSKRLNEEKAEKKRFSLSSTEIIIGVILILIAFIVLAWPQNETSTNDSFANAIREATKVTVPENWITYEFESTYKISVPPTIELRRDYDPYLTNRAGIVHIPNEGKNVFQQKGLSINDENSLNQYCRVIISLIKGDDGDFLASSQSAFIDSDTKEIINEFVKKSIGERARELGNHSSKWVTINNNKAIQIDYMRTANGFDETKPVVGRILLFQNKDKMVTIVLAYRESEADLWKDDFEKIQYSFKWVTK